MGNLKNTLNTAQQEELLVEENVQQHEDEAQTIVYEKPVMGFCDESSSGKLGANNCCSKC